MRRRLHLCQHRRILRVHQAATNQVRTGREKKHFRMQTAFGRKYDKLMSSSSSLGERQKYQRLSSKNSAAFALIIFALRGLDELKSLLHFHFRPSTVGRMKCAVGYRALRDQCVGESSNRIRNRLALNPAETFSNCQTSTSAARTRIPAMLIRCARTYQEGSGAIAESDSLSIRSPTPARTSTSARSTITSAWRASDAITPSAATAVSERRAAERDTLLMRKRRTARVRSWREIETRFSSQFVGC